MKLLSKIRMKSFSSMRTKALEENALNSIFPRLSLPIISGSSFKATNQTVELPQSIFSTDIRKDIIHKVYVYNSHYNRVSNKQTKNKGMVSGSGKKPAKQKGRGMARVGNLRSPHMKKGGHSFNISPRAFFFPLSKKIRLLGMKSVLAAKFSENKIIVLDSLPMNSESITNMYKQILGNKSILCFSTEDDKAEFEKISSAKNVKAELTDKLTVKTLVDWKFIVLDINSLESLCETLEERELNCFKRRKIVNRIAEVYSKREKTDYGVGPYQPLEIHTSSLAGSQQEIYSGKLNIEREKALLFKRAEQRIKKSKL